jgi:hypothetical protein
LTLAGAAGRLLLLALLLVAAGLGACGDEDGGGEQETQLAVPWIDPDGEFPIVGALAVNPADGKLWMSTNTGLFHVPGDGEEPVQVTGELTTPNGSGEISEQLVVRFTGPDELLGSGHPPSDSTLPAALGLMRSEDAAKTWTSVSELGTADFHAIEPAGDRMIGGLFGQAQVLVSGDGGKTWETRAAPRPLVDLAVNPDDPAKWIATTQDGVYVSQDEGGTWRAIDPTPNSYLAWPEPGTLYRLDPGGPLMLSRDGGQAWDEVGSTGGEPQELVAADPMTLYAVLIDGTVKRSADGGRSWTDHVTPPA